MQLHSSIPFFDYLNKLPYFNQQIDSKLLLDGYESNRQINKMHCMFSNITLNVLLLK